MRRKEKTQGMLFTLLSCILILSVLAATIRIGFASKELTPSDIIRFADIYGEITDRFDMTIYEDGEVLNYDLYGSIVGDGNNIHNSLVYKFSDELKPGNINFITGYRKIEEKPRVMKTTLLSESSLQEIAKMFGSDSGCCFAYNYETGEVYTALSFPAYNPYKSNPSFINRCYNGIYIPGSTMKVITTIIAVEQGINLKKVNYECDSVYELPNGKEIECVYGISHGKVDYTKGIGESCNGYFVNLASQFNIDEALETLRMLGFKVNGKVETKVSTNDLSISTSSVEITDLSTFSGAWSFAGQGDDQVNPVHMAMIAGAIANGGKAAEPYIVKSIYNPNKDKFVYQAKGAEMTKFMSSKTANTVAKLWKSGVEEYYYNTYKNISEKISYAKTGTAEYDDNDSKYTNKLLMGTIEESKTAFYIVVEHNSELEPIQVANKLVDILPKN